MQMAWTGSQAVKLTERYAKKYQDRPGNMPIQKERKSKDTPKRVSDHGALWTKNVESLRRARRYGTWKEYLSTSERGSVEYLDNSL